VYVGHSIQKISGPKRRERKLSLRSGGEIDKTSYTQGRKRPDLVPRCRREGLKSEKEEEDGERRGETVRGRSGDKRKRNTAAIGGIEVVWTRPSPSKE